MEPPPTTSVTTHCAALPDPRVARTKRHALREVLTIARGAVSCGADAWVEVARLGHAKAAWLRTLLAWPHGIPCPDTCGRVCAALAPLACERGCLSGVRTVAGEAVAQVVASAGKTLRRAHDRRADQPALHMVSAWATASRLGFGQVAVATQSHAIPALPALLRVLDLPGCTVTIDARGGQTAIARAIRARGADYVLARQDHHPTWAAAVAATFALARANGVADLAPAQYGLLQPIAQGHGRWERRRSGTISDPALLAYRNPAGAWTELRRIGLVEAARRIGGQVTVAARYYLRRLDGAVRAVAGAVRDHWGVENGLHGILAGACREDERRVRIGHGAHNLGVLRPIARKLLRQERTAQVGVKAKRLLAGWAAPYLLQVLTAYDAIALYARARALSPAELVLRSPGA